MRRQDAGALPTAACLKWTHDDINAHMMFGHQGEEDRSIYQLLDALMRGKKQPRSPGIRQEPGIRQGRQRTGAEGQGEANGRSEG